MPVTVRLTDKAPESLKNRLAYRTRRMHADDTSIEVNSNEAAALTRAGWAEAAGSSEPARRGPGRPKKTENQSQPEPAAKPEVNKPKDQPYLTRNELLSVAEKRGVELPPGYVTRDDLAKLVGEVSPDELEQAGR